MTAMAHPTQMSRATRAPRMKVDRHEVLPVVQQGAADDEVVIYVTDALLADGLAELRWLLHDHLLAGARVLVVDLTGVDQLSSTVVAAFLWAHRLCRSRGGGVTLRGANRRTLDLLRRTGLWRVLRVEPAASRRAG